LVVRKFFPPGKDKPPQSALATLQLALFCSRVFERARIRTDLNIGPDTRPGTFSFTGNHWFASDAPARSKPQLPVAEKDPVHGKDPKLNPKTGKPAASKAGAR